jgi:hypothetical protein
VVIATVPVSTQNMSLCHYSPEHTGAGIAYVLMFVVSRCAMRIVKMPAQISARNAGQEPLLHYYALGLGVDLEKFRFKSKFQSLFR